MCVFVIAATACGGGPSSTTTRTVAPLPTVAVNTGAPELDTVARDAIARDDIQLAALAGYATVPCVAGDQAGGSVVAPTCRENEADGMPVEVLPQTLDCQPGYVRPEQVPDAFRAALGDTPKLVAVYTPKPDAQAFGSGFGAGSVVVLQSGTHDDGQVSGVALHIKDGRVVWIERDCTNVFELMTPARVDSYIVSPGGTPAATAPTQPPADTPAP